MKYFFISSSSKQALKAKEGFVKKYDQSSPENADVIIPIGGDGFFLNAFTITIILISLFLE